MSNKLLRILLNERQLNNVINSAYYLFHTHAHGIHTAEEINEK